MDLIAKPLTVETWPQFERLVEAHNGVWGGWWCMAFHPPRGDPPYSAEENRAAKKERVEARCARRARLPRRGLRRLVSIRPGGGTAAHQAQTCLRRWLSTLPDWRITCFLAAKTHRRSGVANVALAGALYEIQRAGGGRVESYPEDVTGRKVSNGFLYNATVSLFEAHGFAPRANGASTIGWS